MCRYYGMILLSINTDAPECSVTLWVVPQTKTVFRSLSKAGPRILIKKRGKYYRYVAGGIGCGGLKKSAGKMDR